MAATFNNNGPNAGNGYGMVPPPLDVSGFVYCPPGWDEARLRSGPDAEAIGKIAMETFTDISYIKEKNAIQISGETHDEVYAAQNQLNNIFFPVIVKSKRQWARPDRPGGWGQRRDAQFNNSPLRKMRSESSLGLAGHPPAAATGGLHGSGGHGGFQRQSMGFNPRNSSGPQAVGQWR
ncbi:hypothetical protein DFJ73DRAFT_756516 [Zopfochytrium polystomum]|nr:hypothetical protein DFJ73DRAFT_756516 [Zopfochytrium polystomum]